MEAIVKKTWDLLQDYKNEEQSRENSIAIRKLEEILQHKMWLITTRQFIADSFKEESSFSSEALVLIQKLQSDEEIEFESHSYANSTGESIYIFKHKGKNRVLIGEDEVESYLNSKDDI